MEPHPPLGGLPGDDRRDVTRIENRPCGGRMRVGMWGTGMCVWPHMGHVMARTGVRARMRTREA